MVETMSSSSSSPSSSSSLSSSVVPHQQQGHVTEGTWRSADVAFEDNFDFANLNLKREVITGLIRCNFVKPSPIQREAIPLGRFGFDLIIQAKSGTGKTCVFVVIALEMIDLTAATKSPQVLIMAPTREIAQQIYEFTKSIGRTMQGLVVKLLVGGTKYDRGASNDCHICIGTPGRIGQMLRTKALKADAIRLLVLDEADKLFDNKFHEQINEIFDNLPAEKQIIAASATYTEKLANFLAKYMRTPKHIRKDKDDPQLLGIKQWYMVTKKNIENDLSFGYKKDAIDQVLSKVPFSQCIIFTNDQIRAQSLCEHLQERKWPALFMSGTQDQKERFKTFELFRSCNCRVLISTDLCARGVDAENVDLVINLDVPWDVETYFHRIGRAGRFGSRGLAITMVTDGQEHHNFLKFKDKANLNVRVVRNVEEDLIIRPERLSSRDVLAQLQNREKRRNDVEAKISEAVSSNAIPLTLPIPIANTDKQVDLLQMLTRCKIEDKLEFTEDVEKLLGLKFEADNGDDDLAPAVNNENNEVIMNEAVVAEEAMVAVEPIAVEPIEVEPMVAEPMAAEPTITVEPIEAIEVVETVVETVEAPEQPKSIDDDEPSQKDDSSGSSSREEQQNKGRLYRHQLHALHRIRRERMKGLVNDKEWGISYVPRIRTSIINRSDFFYRFGEKEKEACDSFNFLDELSTSTPSSDDESEIADEADDEAEPTTKKQRPAKFVNDTTNVIDIVDNGPDNSHNKIDLYNNGN